MLIFWKKLVDLIRWGSGSRYPLCWRVPLHPSAVFFWVFLGTFLGFFSVVFLLGLSSYIISSGYIAEISDDGHGD